MKITLSIIIVSFNTKDFLFRCLESLDPNDEIIIVDNASTDGSVEAINSSKFKNLKIIVNKNNLGFAKAVNQGLKQAKGDYLLLLNSDIVVKPDSINKLIEFAEKHSEAGVVGGRLLNPNNSAQPSVYHFPTIWRAIREYWLRQKGVYEKYIPIGTNPVRVEVVTGAVFLIPKKVLQKVGLLDERYFMYFEDLDYCRRVGQAGYKVYYLPTAEFIHVHGASGQSIPDQTRKWLVKSSQIYHGRLKYFLLSLIIWTGQKWQKLWL